jgi:hypothetical protein
MVFSVPRMFRLFNGLPHVSYNLAQPAAVRCRRPPTPSPPPDESPAFLHTEFIPFEPDLVQEIRQALGEQAARRTGDAP